MPQMKSVYWIWILLGILLLGGLGCIPLLMAEPTDTAVITSNGVKYATVDLRIDQTLTIPAPNGGSNLVTVKDGKIAVTEATCPDHYCMQRGYCNGGTAIVCLPNRLVIEFLAEETVDGAVG